MTNMTNASGVYFGGYDMVLFTSSAFWSGLIANEVGHYFSLRHTFQGGHNNSDCTIDGDGICDTPPKASSGFGGAGCDLPGNSCSTDTDDVSGNNPYSSNSMGGIGDQVDMLSN